jgi:hypothetical protein
MVQHVFDTIELDCERVSAMPPETQRGTRHA